MRSASLLRVASVLHEVLVELFRDTPHLLVELLQGRLDLLQGVPLRFERTEPNFSGLCELEADLVLAVYGADDRVVCALIIEVQLSIKEAKPRSWAVYQASVHRRLRCPAFVVVIAIDPRVARWAAGPFHTGQTTFHPIIIAPRHIPEIARPLDEPHASVELILLSGLAHHDDPVASQIGEVLWHALDQSDDDRAPLYWDLFLGMVGEATRRTLKMNLENWRPQSDWGKKLFTDGRIQGEADGRTQGEADGRIQGEADGRIQGEAGSLVLLLEARGLVLEPRHRALVDACKDSERFHGWLRRAALATHIDEVFGK